MTSSVLELTDDISLIGDSAAVDSFSFNSLALAVYLRARFLNSKASLASACLCAFSLGSNRRVPSELSSPFTNPILKARPTCFSAQVEISPLSLNSCAADNLFAISSSPNARTKKTTNSSRVT
ncbi:hypothetical protein D3C73_970340 [compost metagenome]